MKTLLVALGSAVVPGMAFGYDLSWDQNLYLSETGISTNNINAVAGDPKPLLRPIRSLWRRCATSSDST
ncbi:MAG: hypothetical protein LBG65_01405 [Puniceicoccales bacterium]|nr:hypothetical protein [Puniceicoccales bacterium]